MTLPPESCASGGRVVGVTGGVATGKSEASRRLAVLLGAELFDADACVRELTDRDEAVRARIVAEFGPAVMGPDERVDRGRLRDMVFREPVRRRALEAILHPVVRRRWLERAAEARAAGRWLVLEIPLLFETGAETHCDIVVVVACSQSTQRRRLQEGRGLAGGTAGAMLEAQLPLAEKMARAQHVIWNDSKIEILEQQARLLAGWLQQRHE
jgi:dephospho-CoA kinase